MRVNTAQVQQGTHTYTHTDSTLVVTVAHARTNRKRKCRRERRKEKAWREEEFWKKKRRRAPHTERESKGEYGGHPLYRLCLSLSLSVGDASIPFYPLQPPHTFRSPPFVYLFVCFFFRVLLLLHALLLRKRYSFLSFFFFPFSLLFITKSHKAKTQRIHGRGNAEKKKS